MKKIEITQLSKGVLFDKRQLDTFNSRKKYCNIFNTKKQKTVLLIHSQYE